jgi:hypothetical protein
MPSRHLPRRTGRARGEGGQGTVELALLLPLLLSLALVVVQVGLVARDQVLLVHATREAARAAAVGEAAGPAPAGLDPGRLSLVVSGDGPLVRAVGRYRAPVVVPLLSRLRPDVELRAELATRREG